MFQGGGTLPIPEWFLERCRQLGVEIKIIDPEELVLGESESWRKSVAGW
jgi:hypothetical protein